MSAANEPIRIAQLPDGQFYANVNGITRGSVTVYFDRNGDVLAHTIFEGRMAGEMIEKLLAEIARRGVEFPEEVQS